jgi:predicted transcriptional regulator
VERGTKAPQKGKATFGSEEGKMQVTLYYSEEDKYLLDLVDKLALQQRKSRSAVIMSILEEYFEREKRLGEILVDLGAIDPGRVAQALKEQEREGRRRLIGEILVEKGWVKPQDVERALVIQSRVRRTS